MKTESYLPLSKRQRLAERLKVSPRAFDKLIPESNLLSDELLEDFVQAFEILFAVHESQRVRLSIYEDMNEYADLDFAQARELKQLLRPLSITDVLSNSPKFSLAAHVYMLEVIIQPIRLAAFRIRGLNVHQIVEEYKPYVPRVILSSSKCKLGYGWVPLTDRFGEFHWRKYVCSAYEAETEEEEKVDDVLGVSAILDTTLNANECATIIAPALVSYFEDLGDDNDVGLSVCQIEEEHGYAVSGNPTAIIAGRMKRRPGISHVVNRLSTPLKKLKTLRSKYGRMDQSGCEYEPPINVLGVCCRELHEYHDWCSLTGSRALKPPEGIKMTWTLDRPTLVKHGYDSRDLMSLVSNAG